MTYRLDTLNPEDDISISPVVWLPDRIRKLKIVKGYLKAVFVRQSGLAVEYHALGWVNFPSRHF